MLECSGEKFKTIVMRERWRKNGGRLPVHGNHVENWRFAMDLKLLTLGNPK
jgi:hypothetical protein